jgi:hypothetical protein
MQAIARLLLSVVSVGALSGTLLPIPSSSAAGEANCCLMMKMQAPTGDNSCGHELPPQNNNDDRCCAGCAFCVALITPSATPFIYEPSGDESFAAFSITHASRRERPPVPPPR